MKKKMNLQNKNKINLNNKIKKKKILKKTMDSKMYQMK